VGEHCTCNHGDHLIALCPLHAAAPALLEALETLHDAYAGPPLTVTQALDKAHAAIAAAKGGA
jgi:hypothetical protein